MHFQKNKDKLSAGLIGTGAILILGAIVLLLMNFAPLLELEFKFLLKNLTVSPSDNEVQVESIFTSDDTLSTNFMLLIPKIDALAAIVPDVDPFDKEEYNKALADGIAHAKGSALPGKKGNTFLFAHSGRNFYEGIHMNVQFYLLDKIEKGDLIYIRYYSNIFTYEVSDVKRVWPEEIEYLVDQDFEYNKLTLMSCWPAGINYQRQIVEAKLIETRPF